MLTDGGAGAQKRTNGSTATATNSSDTYVIEKWKSRIGFSRAPTTPARARACSRCASTRNTAPSTSALTAYTGPVGATGTSSSEARTIAHEYATTRRDTARSEATTGSIGTPAAA